MHNRKNSGAKLIVLMILLAMLIGGAIGGTVAWLWVESDPLVNTFASGDLNIKLEEPHFKTNTSDGRHKGLPGDVIAKDPTITVKAGSAPCYVRVFVINWWRLETDSHFRGSEAAGWYNFGDFASQWMPYMNYVDSSSGVRGHLTEFRYHQIIDASESESGITIQGPFSTITVPRWITGEKYASLDDYKVILIAQAVQSEGFADANAAFAAAGLPTGNLGLGSGEGIPQTIADVIALHTAPETDDTENGGSGSGNS